MPAISFCPPCATKTMPTAIRRGSNAQVGRLRNSCASIRSDLGGRQILTDRDRRHSCYREPFEEHRYPAMNPPGIHQEVEATVETSMAAGAEVTPSEERLPQLSGTCETFRVQHYD